jgi:hypothetical protein
MRDIHKRLQIYAGDHGIQVMSLLGAIGVALAIGHGGGTALWLLTLGWVLYLLEEHLIHRFVFHAPPPRQQILFDLLYRLHYGHHDQQRNRHLLFTPLWFAVPIALVTVVGLALVMPRTYALIAVLGGSVPAYLLFEWFHLTSHFRTEKGALGRYVTRRHARHHNVDYHHWFTVSPGGQLVDAALGSSPSRYAVVPNVLTCGMRPDDERLVRSRLRYGRDTSLNNDAAVPVRAHASQAM